MSKFRIPIHPFLICSWFVLLAYHDSQPFVRLPELLKSWAFCLAVVFLINRVLKYFNKELGKASILTSLFVVFFCFLYPIRLQIKHYLNYVPHGPQLSHARYVLPFLCMVFIFMAIVICRTKKNVLRFKIYLNVVSFVIVVMTLFEVVVKPLPLFPDLPTGEKDETLVIPEKNPPDIYYILLDAHTSAESLKTFWNYDNSGFNQFLTTNGFYVVPHAVGDYTATPLCMAASLDMDFPPKLPTNYPFASMAAEMFGIIKEAKAPKKLEAAGYEFVNLSFFPILDKPKFYKFPFLNFSSFADVLFERSAFHYYNAYYKQLKLGDSNLKVFQRLDEIPSEPTSKPRFIYAHLLMPHGPFLFNREGHRVMKGLTVDQDKNDYLDQLIYADQLVMKTVSTILSKSKTPPIIIVQGDHGFRWLKGDEQAKEAPTILNAYYFPGASKELFYEGITPVNSFRLMFNHYFGTHYEYLPDIQHIDKSRMPGR